MRTTKATVVKAFVIIGLLFGFMSALSAMPVAAQGGPVVCQYQLDAEGNAFNTNFSPSLQACLSLYASSGSAGGCAVSDSNGDGVIESASSGSNCVVEWAPVTCNIADSDGDGQIDSVKGCEPPPPTVTPTTPAVTPTTPVVTPTTPVVTPTTPVVTPTTPVVTPTTPTTPATKTPTVTATTPDGGHANPPKTATATTPDPGKADPKKTPEAVAALPSTGSGSDGGGTAIAATLGLLSVLMLAAAAYWQRRTAS